MPPVKPIIYILSGGVGACGSQVVNTALAQFPENSVQVVIIGNVREPHQISELLQTARREDALVVYTLVDPSLHVHLLREAARIQVPAVDLMGPLIEWVKVKTGQTPKGQAGLYRQLHREYYDRVAAIDFAMAHDDGKKPDGWPQAEAVLVGVSRVGKTPLSLYLAVLGWKVANYPLVPSLPIPEELFALDPSRVFGLTLDPAQLLQYRQRRQKQLGVSGASTYIDPQTVYEEVQEALKIFRQAHFRIIDMTNKTIELGADEILRHMEK